MIPSAILGRYARSLMDVVFEENLEPDVTGDLKTYNGIFQAVPALLDAFHTPAVPKEVKERLLGEVMAKYPVNRVTANFLRILLRHGRIRFFQQIFESYLKHVNERKGVLSATVTTAAPLSRQDAARLGEKLAAITGKRVSMELQTDPDLMGGVVVRMGSTIYDGSVRTQLAEVRRRLAGK